MKFTTAFLASMLMGATALADANRKPNIIVILSDDQDLRMKSMDYMPKVQKYLTDEGMYFNHHYATVALCCPSRASLWTGKAAHNTKITDLAPPYGGFPKFISEGFNKKWLPVWLHDSGYNTYFTGKLMNNHNIWNYKNGLGDMGLTGHDFMIEPGTYQYVNTTIQHNMDEPSKPSKYHGQYATDLLSNLTLAWIDDAAKGDSPFFLAINPVNPHNNLDWNGGDQKWTQPVPADRHKDDFPDAIVPRDTENFNPNRTSGASWVKDLKQLDNDTLTDNDHYYRRRLQALQAVDDLVENTVKRLEHHKMLDNTFIIYTSDNGFHISQHRLTPGKRCPYEEDVNVPMVIRGPKVPKGKTVDFVTSHLDIAPTVLNWAGAKGPGDFDGKIIPSGGNPGTKEPWEHVQIEHWGPVSSKDGVPDDLRKRGNTYKAARIIGPKYNLYYAVWCEGDHEIYDMTTDPSQMHNLYNTSKTILDVPIEKLEHRLDAMLLVMKTCKGKTCRRPWEALHPDGKVQTLAEALDTKYDTFYKSQNKVKFEKCARGYHVQNELPIKYHTYGNGTGGGSQDSESMMYRDLDWWMNVG